MKNSNVGAGIIGLFLAILALLLGVTVAAFRNISESAMNSDWVNHTHAVISEAAEMASCVNRGEKSLRDYLLTGSESDRASCRRGYAEAVERLTSGKALTKSEPLQYAEFLALETLLATRVAFVRDLVKARLAEGLEGAVKIMTVASDETSDIQRGVDLIKREEESLLRTRDKASYLQAQNTRWIVLVGMAVNVAVLIFMIYLIRADIVTRRRATALLAEENERLDARIEERTHELAAANKALGKQNLEERWSNQALDHQLRYNQLIINSIDGPVLVISKSSSVTRINPAVTRWTGFESRELVGHPLQRILGLGDFGAPEDLLKVGACMKDGRDLLDSEGVLHGKNERETKVYFSVFPLRDRDRIVGGVVTIKVPSSSNQRAIL